MIYYVAHKYDGKPENVQRVAKITHDLQVNNLSDVFICPLLAFSHLGYNEIGHDNKMALCLDILSVSDVLVVASGPSEGVQKEIDFARMVGMEVIDLADKYRTL